MNYEEAVDHFMTEDGTLTERAEFHVRLGVGLFATAVSKTAHAHGWWDGGNRNMGEMLMLMVSELAEALEAHRDNQPELWYDHGGLMIDTPADDLSRREINGRLGKPEGIAAEFADCIIRILDTCDTLEIPVVQALLDKHRYNITRPYRHGGKAC